MRAFQGMQIWTPEVHRVLGRAAEAAHDLGSQDIKPEHIFLGLSTDESLKQFWETLGFSSADLHVFVSQRSIRQEGINKNMAPFSKEVIVILQSCHGTAISAGRNTICPKDLLDGLMGNATGTVKSIVVQLGTL